MSKDPIVKDVREAGARLAQDAGNDLHALAEMLRKAEREGKWPVASEEVLKKVREKLRRKEA